MTYPTTIEQRLRRSKTPTRSGRSRSEGDTACGSWLRWIASVIGGRARAAYLDAHITYSRSHVGWRIRTIDIHPGIEGRASDST